MGESFQMSIPEFNVRIGEKADQPSHVRRTVADHQVCLSAVKMRRDRLCCTLLGNVLRYKRCEKKRDRSRTLVGTDPLHDDDPRDGRHCLQVDRYHLGVIGIFCCPELSREHLSKSFVDENATRVGSDTGRWKHL